MTTPVPGQLDVLRAAIDRLIPADEFSGALSAGVENYILGQLRGDLSAEASAFWKSVDKLDEETHRRFNTPFASLPFQEQDQILSAWEASDAHSSFFQHLLNLTVEGFYADPGNGGNRGAVSWKMVGYDPRRPANADVTAP